MRKLMWIFSPLLLLSAKPVSPAASPQFEIPLDCTVGVTCFIQQYYDHDPSKDARDYRCGARVYDGHDGVDIRLPTIAAQRRGVSVVAAATGMVRSTRNTIDDVIATPENAANFQGRECGNGVVIDHAGGWQTQYCHMANGSVRVQPGQMVNAGGHIGSVGLSGDTQFPHLHFAVRHEGMKIDPFAASPKAKSCQGQPQLWSRSASAALAYHETEIINAGFGTARIEMADIEEETIAQPTRDAAAIVFYGRAIGLAAGDIMELTITKPDGGLLTTERTTMKTAMAQYFGFAGRKRPPGGWLAGRYTARCRILRGTEVTADIATGIVI